MGDLLRLPLRLFRRAATPPAALERQAQGSPQPEPAASQICEVVRLADRRPAPALWCPPIPYVGAILLGAVLTTAAVSMAADFYIAAWRV